LEHIPDNQKVIQSFYEALKEEGIFYLAMPSYENTWQIFPRRWFRKFYEWEEHEHIGEQYNLVRFLAKLREIGFDTVLARHTFTFWGALAWELEFLVRTFIPGPLNIIMMPLYKLLGLLDIYLPLGKGHHLVIARKKSSLQ
jgi:SAM-dependent methyltransferase